MKSRIRTLIASLCVITLSMTSLASTASTASAASASTPGGCSASTISAVLYLMEGLCGPGWSGEIWCMEGGPITVFIDSCN